MDIKKLVIIRRCSQGLFLLLFVFILMPMGEHLAGMFPAKLFLRSSPLMVIRISMGTKAIAGGIGVALIVLLLTMVFGRFFCGWICPMGTMIDCAGSLKKKRKVFSDTANRKISSAKFYLLGIFLILAFFKVQTAGVADPLVIMAKVVLFYIIPALSMLFGFAYDYILQLQIPFLIFILILGISVFIPRLWCRVLCPLGALYALVSKFALLRRVAPGCSDCKVCSTACRMGAIKDGGDYVKTECVLCMDCVYCCDKGDVKFTWSRRKD
jgi:polyferredoxin